jgi:hypothetical protein
VDGAMRAAGEVSGDPAQPIGVTAGKLVFGDAAYVNTGTLGVSYDEIAIYDRVLTLSEIQAHVGAVDITSQ